MKVRIKETGETGTLLGHVNGRTLVQLDDRGLLRTPSADEIETLDGCALVSAEEASR